MTNTIANGVNTPLTERTGTIPDVSEGMRDWFQPMSFIQVTKTTVNFQVVETQNPTPFQGVIQPASNRELWLRPEGERAWSWLTLHADPVLTLEVDDIVQYLGVNYRVKSRKAYQEYGYQEYMLLQDWTPIPEGSFSYTILQYGMTMPGVA